MSEPSQGWIIVVETVYRRSMWIKREKAGDALLEAGRLLMDERGEGPLVSRETTIRPATEEDLD